MLWCNAKSIAKLLKMFENADPKAAILREFANFVKTSLIVAAGSFDNNCCVLSLPDGLKPAQEECPC
jgi:hypothetical protein